MQGFEIDEEAGEGVEGAHRTEVAHERMIEQELAFGMTVGPLRAGALTVDSLIERAVTVEAGAHLSARFPVEGFDTTLALSELLVLTALCAGLGKEERTAKALGPVAVGRRELVGRIHAQLFLTQRHAISRSLALGMTVRVERDSGNAPTVGTRLIDVPSIKSGISGDVRRVKAEVGHGLQVERHKVGDVVLVESLSLLGEDDITIVGDVGTGQAQSIAPQLLILFGRATISLLLVGRAFDPQAAIRIAFGLQVRVEALFDILAQVILFDVGIDVGHVEGDDLA